MSAVAVIPARGGSKRIPRKNVAPFHGRPMIGWPIKAARRAGCFARIIVSTDDEEIAAVAIAEGAEAPFRRPAPLADDHTPTVPVIAHAVEVLGLPPETPVCCLYATAALVEPADLRAGLERLATGAGVRHALSVVRFGFPVQRALHRDDEGFVRMTDPRHLLSRSQDLEPAWHDAGQFYWARAETWRAGTPVFGPGAAGIELPRARVQDIDTPEDWALAELLFAHARRGGGG
jgi:pseudaminic acid cytidylyltransferase